MHEISRIKNYVAKINEIEKKSQPETQGLKIDKEAASRFIKHSLSQDVEKRQRVL